MHRRTQTQYLPTKYSHSHSTTLTIESTKKLFQATFMPSGGGQIAPNLQLWEPAWHTHTGYQALHRHIIIIS